jgi:hypothetical protein
MCCADKEAVRGKHPRYIRQEPILNPFSLSTSSRVHAHSNDFDDTDTPQIPAEPETPEEDEENLPELPDPTEVGEDG